MYKYFFKRIFDFLLSFIGLVILIIPFILIAFIIKIDSKGPVFFKQKRIGKKGKVFTIYKFRSMVVNAEKDGVYSDNKDKRLTKVGKVLRKTSIDELPQLINIFLGHMSFIGFRPILTYHPWTYDKYTEREKQLFSVRPGITGWAQIHGRKTVDWKDRLEYNIWYSQHISFFLDVKIFFLTIFKVFKNSDNENIGASLTSVIDIDKNANKFLDLMYITANPQVAMIAEKSGVDRIWIDMEYIGKEDRQKNCDCQKNHHTIEDVKTVKSAITTAELIVRVNPIHENTKEEIEQVLDAGADIIMLPMFKTVEEVSYFVKCVGGRAKINLLFETPESIKNVDEILKIDNISEAHVGLNDLHLALDKKFMFELLTDGTVESLAEKFKKRRIKFGFGGVAAIGKGTLPAENIIAEHCRMGSTCAILSRSFCNTSEITDIDKVREIFEVGLQEIRNYEKQCLLGNVDFESNKMSVIEKVNEVVKSL